MFVLYAATLGSILSLGREEEGQTEMKSIKPCEVSKKPRKHVMQKNLRLFKESQAVKLALELISSIMSGNLVSQSKGGGS